jgi:hypothetical protein
MLFIIPLTKKETPFGVPLDIPNGLKTPSSENKKQVPHA